MMRPSSHGFATVLVVWVVAVTAIMLVGIQASAFRQAAAGREALARTRAYWAARGGIEATIARLAHDTENPDPSDPLRVVYDMEDVAQGEYAGASYLISHTANDVEVLGPEDAHAKINVASMPADALLNLPYMTEDMADAIVDWIDADDDVSNFGAEYSRYLQQEYPYVPRNGPIRSMAELELVLGIEPDYVRGEDEDLNGLLDAWEDDGNGQFDAQWGEYITASSIGGGYGLSGLPKINLADADPGDVAGAAGLSAGQADVAVQWGSGLLLGEDRSMADFMLTPLATMFNQLNQGPDAIPGARPPENLTDEQLAQLLAQADLYDPFGDGTPAIGKVNINTASDRVLEVLPGVDIAVIDALIAARNARGSSGFASITEILDETVLISQDQLAQLSSILDVRSNVYICRSLGRDEATGIEIEIIATLDRSTLPVTIREIRVR
jgi:Type II secretion system (T2SS), protein K